MKQKTIIIKDKQKALDIGYGPLIDTGDDSDILVVENKHPKFRIIQDFAQEQYKQTEEVVVNEEIYFAEEIFDDEDDIYLNSMKDRLLQKEHHRSIFDIGETINKALLTNGFKANIGLSLLASMQFSRFIHLPTPGSQQQFIKALFESIGNPMFITTSSAGGQDDHLAHEDLIYRAIEFANNNKNRPVFVYTDNLRSKEVFEYYRHFYSYIDNPDGDTYLTALGRSQYIPHNLYFIFSLQEGQCSFDIARRLYRYVTFIEGTFSEVEPSQTKENITISLEELRAALREASDTYGIKEDIWKKFDGIIEVIHEVNGFVLQNKIARRLEDYAISYFTSSLESIEVMDHVLANNFIHEAIITSKPQLYNSTYDLNKTIDNNFGPESLPLTRAVIRDYMNLFDKGGSRIDG